SRGTSACPAKNFSRLARLKPWRTSKSVVISIPPKGKAQLSLGFWLGFCIFLLLTKIGLHDPLLHGDISQAAHDELHQGGKSQYQKHQRNGETEEQSRIHEAGNSQDTYCILKPQESQCTAVFQDGPGGQIQGGVEDKGVLEHRQGQR